MSVVEKILNFIRLNEDEDEDEDDIYDEDEMEEEEDDEDEEVGGLFQRFKNRKKEEPVEEEEEAPSYYTENRDIGLQRGRKAVVEPVKEKPARAKVMAIRTVQGKAGENMQVCVIKPTAVEEEREITETLLDGRAVIINMEGLDVNIAQRIIDFTSGSTYAIRGNLQKISNFIFIATPENVEISGDFQSIMDEFERSEYSL